MAPSHRHEPSTAQPPSVRVRSPSLSPPRDPNGGNQPGGAAAGGEREKHGSRIPAVEFGELPGLDDGAAEGRGDGREEKSGLLIENPTANVGGTEAVSSEGPAVSRGVGIGGGALAGEAGRLLSTPVTGVGASNEAGEGSSVQPVMSKGGALPGSRATGGNGLDPLNTPIAGNHMPCLSGNKERVEPSQVFATPPCRHHPAQQHGQSHTERNGKREGNVLTMGRRGGFEGKSSYFQKKPASAGVLGISPTSGSLSKSMSPGESDERDETTYDGNNNDDFSRSVREAYVSGGRDSGDGEVGEEAGEGECEGEGDEGDAELPPSCTGASGMATDVSHVTEFGRIGHRAVSEFVARMRRVDDLPASSARDSPLSPRSPNSSPFSPISRGPVSTLKGVLGQGGAKAAGAKRTKPQRGGGARPPKW